MYDGAVWLTKGGPGGAPGPAWAFAFICAIRAAAVDGPRALSIAVIWFWEKTGILVVVFVVSYLYIIVV